MIHIGLLKTPFQTDAPFLRHRLGRRIVLYALVFSFLITLIGASVHLYSDFQDEQSALAWRLQEIEASHLPIIREELWLSHRDAVALQLAGLVRQPHMHHVVVTLPDGEEIFQGKREGGALVRHTFALEKYVEDRMVPLGTLEVGITLEEIQADLWDQVWVVLISWAVGTSLFSLVILFLLHVMVGRRIHQMAEYARLIRLKRLDALELLPCRPVTNGSMDELDHLAVALNQMVSELRISYAQAQTLSLSICKERDRATQYLDLVGGIIVEIDHNEQITLINKAGCALLGHDRVQDVVGKNWFDTFLPETIRAHVRTKFHDVLAMEGQHTFPVYENPIVQRDGSMRDVLWRNVLIEEEPGAKKRSLSHGIDVTERKQAERLLFANQALLHAIINNTQAVIFTKDLNGRFLSVNRQFEHLFGIAEGGAVGLCDHDLFPPEVADRLRAHDRLALESGSVEQAEEIPLPDGTGRDYLSLKFCLRNPDGQPYAVCTIATDITELKQIQANLQWNAHLNLALQQLSRLLIAPDYQLTDVANRVLAYAQALTGSRHGYISELNPAGEYCIVSFSDAMTAASVTNHKKSGFSVGVDGRYPGLKGHALNLKCGFFTNNPTDHPAFQGGCPAEHIPLQRFLAVPILLNHRPVGQIILANAVEDYTQAGLDAITQLGELYALAIRQKQAFEEKQQVELRLFHAQKLEAVGLLAAGVAHDFNNILAIMMGNAEYGQLACGADQTVKTLFDDMLQASLRGRDLVKQLLNFSHQHSTEACYFQPQTILKETMRLLRSTIPSTVVMVSTIDDSTETVYGDPVQLQQVLMNLCSNAVHAMDGQSNPLLEVGFQPVKVDAPQALVLDVVAGDYGCLTVRDNGCGISDAVRQQMFDPFFTTKSVGVGTGLGLAMVQSYLRGIGGTIEVESREGEGALFRVYLPLSVERARASFSTRQSSPAVRKERGRILVVDDEAQLVKVTVRMLELLGYQAEPYCNATLALACFERDPVGYQAAILDLAMPEMSGEVLGKRIYTLRQDMPIFLCSGFLDQNRLHVDTTPWLTGLLSKPVSIGELEAVLAVEQIK